MAMDEGRSRPRRPFLRRDAARLGIPSRAFRGKRYRPLLHGVRVSRDVPLTPEIWGSAALLLHPPGAFISHRWAAAIYGVPAPKHADVDVSVVRIGDRRFSAGLKPHLAHDDADVIDWHGVRVSSPHRTFCELARSLTLVDLVVLGDRLVAKGLCTVEELRDHAARWKGYCRRQAIRAADLVRAGVDSPMETRLRLLLVLAGLPEPQINYKLRWADGAVRRRLDLSYPGIKLIVEYDGRHHALDTEQWEIDNERLADLAAEGWSLLVVRSKGIYQSPLRTLQRVRTALVQRGYPGVPAHFDDEWTAHFPTR